MRHVFHTLLLLGASGAAAAPFEMQYVGTDGKPYGGVVVTLRSTNASRPLASPPAKPRIMDQIDRQFAPQVLVIAAGTAVSFPNSDTVAHQVYSNSEAKEFDLPLYSGKALPQVQFDTPGIVTLGCNIHDLMIGYVYVVEGQYFGRADRDGRWSEPNVEPGDYQLTIWHPLSRKKQEPVLEQRVTIKAEGTRLTLRAPKKLSLRSQSQVPATWDVY